MKDHIDILFVPFGKAESENNGEHFFCQHGPAECSRNRIQSCVLNELIENQSKAVEFVGCQMNRKADFSGKECAEKVNVEYSTLFECFTSDKGKELQLIAQNQTQKIRDPYPTFVPTIVYNHVITEQKNEMTQ